MLQKIAIRTGACYLCIEKNVNSQKTKGQVIYDMNNIYPIVLKPMGVARGSHIVKSGRS